MAYTHKGPKRAIVGARDALREIVWQEDLEVGDKVTHRSIRIAGYGLEFLRRDGLIDNDNKLTELGLRFGQEAF